MGLWWRFKDINHSFTNLRRNLFILILLSPFLFLGQNAFEKLAISTDSTYGYSIKNPIKINKETPLKSIEYTNNFISALRTKDNLSFNVSKRYSLEPPRKTFSTTNLIDVYLLTTEKQDTIYLYVDISKGGKLFIPKGLKINNK